MTKGPAVQTATEMRIRAEHAQRRLEPIWKRIDWTLGHALFKIMHEVKAPLIKYGRRKRRWRRILPRYDKIEIKF